MLSLLLSINLEAATETQFEMLTLMHRMADDLLPVVQPMVGVSGSVRAIDNHLLVTTTAERMSAIREIVARLDVERRNVRIAISHKEMSIHQHRNADIGGSVRLGNTEIRRLGRAPEGVTLDITQQEKAMSSHGDEYLTVLDGEYAFIRVGQSVPYNRKLITLTQRYAQIEQVTEYHDVSTGFAVRPRYIGNQVELEVMPRIASMNGGRMVDFESLVTTVRLTPGVWFDLGGAMQSRDEVSRTILGLSEDKTSRNFNLMIKVD